MLFDFTGFLSETGSFPNNGVKLLHVTFPEMVSEYTATVNITLPGISPISQTEKKSEIHPKRKVEQ